MTQTVKMEGKGRGDTARENAAHAGTRNTRRAWAYDFDLALTRRGTVIALAAGLALYAGLWFVPWQGAVPLPALRVLIAFLLWLIPGWVVQQLLWDGKVFTTSQRLALSFGVAVALAAGAGVVATALGLSLPFVIGTLVVITGAGTVTLVARGGWRWTPRARLEITPAQLWMLLPVALTCLLVVRLTGIQGAITDDLTYTAYLSNWLYSDHYSWNEIFLGLAQPAPSRFWLALFPLSEALVARAGGVHGLELTQFYFSPLLALYGLLAVYALARAFDLSRAVSCFAVTAQVAGLLLLTSNDQPGVYFFNRLVEDKVISVFVLLPVFVLAATAFLKRADGRRAVLVLATGAALVLTHPTITGIAVALVGLFAVFDFLARRNGRATLGLLVLLGVILAVPLGLRLFDLRYSTKIVFGLDEDLMRDGQLRRVLEWNDSLFGVNPVIVAALPYAWLLIAAGVALMQFKTSFAARWLVVSALVILSVIFPLTATAWSTAIPAAQLYRVVWTAPFGIAAAYLAMRLWDWLAARAKWRQDSDASFVLPVAALVLLAGGLASVLAGANWKNLHGLKPPAVAPGAYTDLLALQPALTEQLTRPTVLVGGDKWLNDRLPSVTANARVFVFRSARNMWQLGNQTRPEAQARYKAWRALIDGNTAAIERLAILDAHQARFVVAEVGTYWVEQILRDTPGRLVPVSQQGQLVLYELTGRERSP